MEKKLHINALELKAASIAVRSMTKRKEKIHIHLKMDIVTAVTYVNKMRGTKSPILTENAKDLWEYCLAKKITLTAEHLPGFLNQTADWESGNVSTITTNSGRLNPQIFTQMDLQWGPLEMDLFADRPNARAEKYMSWKPDPFFCGYRCIPSKQGRDESLCISPILSHTEMCSESSEREGRIGDCNTNMTDTTLLCNAIEHVNCRSYSSTTIEEPSSVTRGGGNHTL